MCGGDSPTEVSMAGVTQSRRMLAPLPTDPRPAPVSPLVARIRIAWSSAKARLIDLQARPADPIDMRTGGWLLMEIGWNQGALVRDLAKSHSSYGEFRIIQDLNGKDRVVCLKKIR